MLCLPFLLYLFFFKRASLRELEGGKASQPGCFGYKFLLQLYPGALQVYIKARKIPGTIIFFFSFPSPQARGSYRHGAIVPFRRIQDYVCSSVVCQLLFARNFSVGLQWGGTCMCGTANLCWKPRH